MRCIFRIHHAVTVKAWVYLKEINICKLQNMTQTFVRKKMNRPVVNLREINLPFTTYSTMTTNYQ